MGMNNEDEIIIDELSMPTLPVDISSQLSNPNDFYKMAFQFQSIMMIYESIMLYK